MNRIFSRVWNLACAKCGYFVSQTQDDVTDTADLYAATKQSFSRLKTGMFWFDDNTFSVVPVENRIILAIVLKAEQNKVVGILPQEDDIIYYYDGNYAYERPQILDNSFYQKCVRYMPRRKELQLMSLFREKLNVSLKTAGWSLLQGEYWIWNWLRRSPIKIYDIESGEEKPVFEEAVGKGRYLIEMILK